VILSLRNDSVEPHLLLFNFKQSLHPSFWLETVIFRHAAWELLLERKSVLNIVAMSGQRPGLSA
jgi:hypothetical protein